MTHKEYEVIYNAYRSMVYKVAWMYLRQKEDAEDITADVFATIWIRRDSIIINTVKQYLNTLIKHRCIDYLRTKKYHTSIDKCNAIDNSLSSIYESICNKELHSIVELLPPKQMRIIKMQYIEGHQPIKISEHLNIKFQTVRNTTQQALVNLRRYTKSRGITYHG